MFQASGFTIVGRGGDENEFNERRFELLAFFDFGLQLDFCDLAAISGVFAFAPDADLRAVTAAPLSKDVDAMSRYEWR